MRCMKLSHTASMLHSLQEASVVVVYLQRLATILSKSDSQNQGVSDTDGVIDEHHEWLSAELLGNLLGRNRMTVFY